jgi:predicted methyltransferase
MHAHHEATQLPGGRTALHVVARAGVWLAVLQGSVMVGGVLQSGGALAAEVVVPPAIQFIVDSPDRSQADRDIDKRRHPAQLLAFAGVKPGMTVFDFGTGRGYTAELLARAVGPKGSVIAQNDPIVFDKFLKGQWDPRFASPPMKNVTPVVRASDDPVPAGAGPFDLITAIYMYHDTVWMGRDRQAMNRAFFGALKPGGHLILVDHSGRPGTGTTQTDTLHRIEESVVKSELEAAGFTLEDEAQFLRNPDDPHDAPFFKSSVPVDGFVLKYVKP